jgi:hypothetical protein
MRNYEVQSGCPARTFVYEFDQAIPCGRLGYRKNDSLLFASYVPLGPSGSGEVDCNLLPDDSLRLVAGKLSGSTFMPLTKSLDTASLLIELRANDSSDVPLRYNGGSEGAGTLCGSDSCCFGARTP